MTESKLIRRARHAIVKIIAPKVYLGSLLNEQLLNRPFTKVIKQATKSSLTGAEIGTAEGLNAKRVCDFLNIKMLYLIDPYLSETGKIHQKHAHQLLKDYPVTFIQKTSERANSMFMDNSLDFVYIDGNHNFSYVKKDLELYYTKIKPNGIICGHDFSGRYLGVVKAVMQFAEKNKLDLNTGQIDWWIKKND